MEEDRDMRIVVRGGVYEVDLAEWKCRSIYWPGEAFDIQRGTWFQEITWQPLQCEYADRIEQEHLNHFRGHKMADYVWDSATQQRLEKQVDQLWCRCSTSTKRFVCMLISSSVLFSFLVMSGQSCIRNVPTTFSPLYENVFLYPWKKTAVSLM